MNAKKTKTITKFISPLSMKKVPNKTEKSLRIPITISRNNVNSPNRTANPIIHSKFTTIYNHYHLIYANFITKGKELNTTKAKTNSQKSQLLVNKKKPKDPPIKSIQKKNGLTLIPNTSIDPGIISDKLNEIVVHSVIANRRVEYSKILQIERLKYINKVVVIQRKWRAYYKKRLTKTAICIQRIYRKQITRRKVTKKCLNALRFEYYLRLCTTKKCLKRIKEYYSLKLCQIDDQLENDIKGDFDRLKGEESLRIKANSQHTESILDLEESKNEEDNDCKLNEDSDDGNSDSHTIKSHLIILNQWVFMTKENCSLPTKILSHIKFIQQFYHKHLMNKQKGLINNKLKILFSRFMNLVMKKKVKIFLRELFLNQVSSINNIPKPSKDCTQNTLTNHLSLKEQTNAQENERAISNAEKQTQKSNNDWNNVYKKLRDQILTDTYTSYPEVGHYNKSYFSLKSDYSNSNSN